MRYIDDCKLLSAELHPGRCNLGITYNNRIQGFFQEYLQTAEGEPGLSENLESCKIQTENHCHEDKGIQDKALSYLSPLQGSIEAAEEKRKAHRGMPQMPQGFSSTGPFLG